ncbi:hypothetical protein J2X68_002445 [Streptomyces sp. 3330]|uniref:hypothetical protein n=1 Tax=Streptomyces sp. 3330 TaxID=2817755 RepID=UPI00285A4E8D|nr:hypothetical protein [Streptomyces sp. 3330]MDR6975757.1 hypothetical protein [Streptomyces sp. 3330]
MPIFIRCPGHLYGDAQFGQIDQWGDSAGIIRSDGPPPGRRRKNRLPPAGRHPQDPAMSTFDALLPLTPATALPARGRQQPGRPRRRDAARP